LLGSILCAHAASTPNPVRKVVQLLQSMQKKVSEEGEKEHDLYEKFMCYCKHSGGDLSASIESGGAKIESVSSDLKESEASSGGTKERLQQSIADRAAGERAMREASSLREKEATAYAEYKGDHDTNLVALEKAIAALEKGVAGGFLQTSSATILRSVVPKLHDLSDDDRQVLMSFLSAGSNYSPQSGQIIGILKQMHDEMSGNSADATAAEEAAIQMYNDLMAAKKKEKAALTAAIEEQTGRVADLGVAIAEMSNDLEDTQEALAADESFMAELKKGCKTKTSEWEARSKLRADELSALADTIKVLNDDDSLELFKKTLPSSSSFAQLQSQLGAVRSRALAVLRSGARSTDVDIVMLALHGKKIGFGKVIGMIDTMVATLKKEQTDDDNKQEYCGATLDASDDKMKGLQRKDSRLSKAISVNEESIANLKDDIAALIAGIKTLDESVADATANRKAEHTEYTELIASNSAAKEVLGFAKNRLAKFYTPKLYKEAAPRELSRMDTVAANNGVAPPPTTAPGGIANTGITVFAQVSMHAHGSEAPALPPATWEAYSSKSGEHGGVVAMISLLVSDLDKEMTEAETEEKDAQADYGKMMTQSAQKRAADSKDLEGKQAAKAEAEAALDAKSDDRASTQRAIAATTQFIMSLHAECDWLLKYHSMRADARRSEIDSLHSAKAVLNGADY